MRARTGEESIKHRRDEASGNDGLHSIDGGGVGDGSIAPTKDPGAGAGGADRGDARDVTKAPWFDPVDQVEISDCPGGVCPVPWAVKEEPPVIIPDMVDHPPHYTDGGTIECIEAIEAQLTDEEYRGYLKGNVAKYLWRERHKGGTESLKKAQWYLKRLIELED